MEKGGLEGLLGRGFRVMGKRRIGQCLFKKNMVLSLKEWNGLRWLFTIRVEGNNLVSTNVSVI